MSININNIFQQLKLYGQNPDGTRSLFLSEWNAVRCIGRGNFSVVFEIEGVDENVQKHSFVLRIIELDVQNISRFKDQIYSLNSINRSPNCVCVEDFSEICIDDDGYYRTYLVIRTELLNVLPINGLSEHEVVQMALNICDTLSECHDKYFIHRAIKPNNILLSEDGDYKLSVFGEAWVCEDVSNEFRGASIYMAPEMYSSSEIDQRSDMYSLGMTMYVMLNKGQIPFVNKATTIGMAIYKLRYGKKLPKIKGASFKLQRIIQKLCQVDPSKRYQSAHQLRDDLIKLRNTNWR